MKRLLRLTTARERRSCDRCGGPIKKGSEYFREAPGPKRVPRQIHMGCFCLACARAKAGFAA